MAFSTSPTWMPHAVRMSMCCGLRRGRGDWKKKKRHINFRRSARICWVGDGPPSLARGGRQGRRRRRRQGGPAPIQEIRADLRKFMFMAFFSFSIKERPLALEGLPLLGRSSGQLWGGLAPIQEIRADLRKFMFLAFF